MPLSAKGMRMKRALIRKFGARKGTRLFYQLEAKGKIPGARKPRRKTRRKNVKGR